MFNYNWWISDVESNCSFPFCCRNLWWEYKATCTIWAGEFFRGELHAAEKSCHDHVREGDENCSWHQLEVPTLAATDGNHGGKTLIENCINKKHPWDIHEPFAVSAAVSNPAIASKNLWILNLQGPCPSRESTEVWQPHRSKREWHDVTRNGGS